jgi:asparagine synthase (glutamine-hydrolysing)
MNRAFLLRQLSYGFGKPANHQSIYWMAAVAPIAQQELWRDSASVEADLARELESQFPTADDLSLLSQCQHQFLNGYLANDILQKMDRASMYNSLEVRSPYLSTQVADFALSLPTHFLLKGMTSKYVLREIGGRYLPEQTIERRKHGFGLPVSALLRSDLRELAESVLLDSSNPMYQHIDFEPVSGWWSQHTRKKRDHGKALWCLLMMAAFFRNQF